jgi:hypothetical protein
MRRASYAGQRERATASAIHSATDLYDGEVFDELDDGIAKRDAIGIPEFARRAAAPVETPWSGELMIERTLVFLK